MPTSVILTAAFCSLMLTTASEPLPLVPVTKGGLGITLHRGGGHDWNDGQHTDLHLYAEDIVVLHGRPSPTPPAGALNAAICRRMAGSSGSQQPAARVMAGPLTVSDAKAPAVCGYRHRVEGADEALSDWSAGAWLC